MKKNIKNSYRGIFEHHIVNEKSKIAVQSMCFSIFCSYLVKRVEKGDVTHSPRPFICFDSATNRIPLTNSDTSDNYR